MWKYVLSVNIALIACYIMFGICVALIPVSIMENFFEKSIYRFPNLGNKLKHVISGKKREEDALLNRNIGKMERNQILINQIFRFSFPATLFSFLLLFSGSLLITIYPQIPYLSYFVGEFPQDVSLSLLLIIGIGFGKFLVGLLEGVISMLLGFGCTYSVKQLFYAKTIQNS